MKKYKQRVLEVEAAYFDGTLKAATDLQKQLGNKILTNIRVNNNPKAFLTLTVKRASGEVQEANATDWLVKKTLSPGIVDVEVIRDQDFIAAFVVPEKEAKVAKAESTDNAKQPDLASK
jgi:hypothetical protein